MKAYIIWNYKDHRPLVNRHEYGNILLYTSEINAQAFIKTREEESGLTDAIIKEVTIQL